MLFALPLAFTTTSCSDDDDLPNVEMSITVSGAECIDGTIYVVQGNTLNIESINVTNNEPDKAATITSADYYWDYRLIGTAMLPPYGFKIETVKTEGDIEGTPLGEHLLQIEAPLLAVDKEVATAILVYKVVVVASEDEIPENPDPDQPATIGSTPTLRK